MSNDLTESSIEELMKMFKPEHFIHPTRVIVPPWVWEEVRAQYGEPVTQEKYHKWNAKRLGLDELTYRRRIS